MVPGKIRILNSEVFGALTPGDLPISSSMPAPSAFALATVTCVQSLTTLSTSLCKTFTRAVPSSCNALLSLCLVYCCLSLGLNLNVSHFLKEVFPDHL